MIGERRLGVPRTDEERLARHRELYGEEELPPRGTGLMRAHPKETSAKCAAVLDRGLTKDVCQDFREMRRWVLCRTWELLDSGQASSFKEARRMAEAERKKACVLY